MQKTIVPIFLKDKFYRYELFSFSGTVTCSLILWQFFVKYLLVVAIDFWDEVKDINFDLKSLFKVRDPLEKLERKWQEIKGKKLSNLSKKAEIKKFVLARYRENLSNFKFKFYFTSFCES